MSDNYNPFNSQNNDDTANGGYSYNREELHNRGTDDGYYQPPEQPQTSSYSAYARTADYAPRPKKEKKGAKFSLSAVIACCVICSILGGTISAGTLLFLEDSFSTSYNTESADNGESTSTENRTVINVSNEETEQLVTAVAQKASPSVVGIRASAQSYTFWGQVQKESGEGSGIIYSQDGYIITNYHVISTAVEASSGGSIEVFLPEDPETAINATVVGYYSESDLAVIKIDRTGLTAIEMGDSYALEIGQTAIAIGNPGGLQYMGSVSCGIISGLNRTLKLEGIEEMALIQTDAAINPGNSGGALVNTSGELIGVNSSKIGGDGFEGMGFAIPSNFVKELCDDIISNKDVKRAYIGVKISTEYDSDSLQAMGYPAGAVVESVVSGSPADQIGIEPYDIITQVDGVDVSNYSEYNAERLKHNPGDTITLQIYRNGKLYNAQITLGESIS